MSKEFLIKEAEKRIKNNISEFNRTVVGLIKESGIELSEPYTFGAAPDWVKKLPKEAHDAWVKAFNAAYKEYNGNESKAFATASSTIEKMGYKKKGKEWIKEVNDVFSKTLLSELLVDIDLIITQAGDGLKGREGSPIVRAFLKEVKAKVKNMIAKIADKETRTLAESIVTKLEEIDKTGSFGDIEAQVRAAIKASTWFPEKVGEQYAEGPYIRDMYPDRCVVSYQGKLYEMEYSIMNEAVILGTPREVIEQYVPVTEAAKEKNKKIEFTKANIKVETLRESQEQDFVVSEFVSLKEAKFNDDFSEVEVVLIEAGVNEGKKRYYPDATVLEAAGIFTGWKMYLNHPTITEEKELPERDITKWASTIVESYPGKNEATGRPTALGKVAIHDSWLRERLADPVARQHIGLSINTGGKISVGRVNGQEGYQIVEAIIPRRKNGPPSVDWVTEAGARGRVSRLLESKTKGVKMELENATLKDLKESRQDLVTAINAETTAGNTEKVTKLEKDLKEANDKIVASEKIQKLAKQAQDVDVILKEAKIPEPCKDRIRTQVKDTLVEGDLKESVGKMIAAELEFANKLSGKGKIKLGSAGETVTIKESLGEELDKRAGIEKKKETETE